MTTRAEKDRKKLEQEHLQRILNSLLRDEDNKYCADCDAKGPRWASWNLGVFLCIRCAGIHRNLGVHISKVKSVNLDSWTPEQVAHMQCYGNSVCRGVYEAHIPDGFRRPQTDSSLEAFIRAKYEQKRYIVKDWTPPRIDRSQWPVLDAKPGSASANMDREVAGQRRSKPTPAVPPPPAAGAAVKTSPGGGGGEGGVSNLVDLTAASAAQPAKAAASIDDILGLDNDFGPMSGGGTSAQPVTNNNIPHPPQQQPQQQQAPQQPQNAAADDLSSLMQSPQAGDGGDRPKSTTDILALYGSNSSSIATSPVYPTQPQPTQPQHAMFAQPGMQAAQPPNQMFGAQPMVANPFMMPPGGQAPPPNYGNMLNQQMAGLQMGGGAPQQSAFGAAAPPQSAAFGAFPQQQMGQSAFAANTLATNLWQ